MLISRSQTPTKIFWLVSADHVSRPFQREWSLTDEWIKKMWYLHTVEFYSAMKKNEILTFAGKWVEPENIILSRSAKLRRPKIVCSPSYADFRSRTNAAMWLDWDHMTRGEDIWVI
jgi:hypothetical protein